VCLVAGWFNWPQLAQLRLLHTPRELAARTACENKIPSFCSRSPGSAVLAASSCHIILRELCSRAVSENYCVIGQFEVGAVNSLSAGAECAKCLAFCVTCAAVGGPFVDFAGVQAIEFSWSMKCPGSENKVLASRGVCSSL